MHSLKNFHFQIVFEILLRVKKEPTLRNSWPMVDEVLGLKAQFIIN